MCVTDRYKLLIHKVVEILCGFDDMKTGRLERVVLNIECRRRTNDRSSGEVRQTVDMKYSAHIIVCVCVCVCVCHK